MASVDYKPNPKGVKEMLNTQAVRNLLMKSAGELAERANGMYDASGYGVAAGSRSEFPKAFVYTGDIHTIRSNRLHMTLEKVIYG